MKRLVTVMGMTVLVAFFSTGCRTIQKLYKSESHPAAPTPDILTVTGNISVDNQLIQIRTLDSSIEAKVKRPGETSWYTCNKYEFKILSNGIAFSHEVTMLPDGRLTWMVPTVPVAPVGTQYQVTSYLQVGTSSREMF